MAAGELKKRSKCVLDTLFFRFEHFSPQTQGPIHVLSGQVGGTHARAVAVLLVAQAVARVGGAVFVQSPREGLAGILACKLVDGV